MNMLLSINLFPLQYSGILNQFTFVQNDKLKQYFIGIMSADSNSVGGKNNIKIVLLGNSGVGKTALIERFINNKFQISDNPTIGIDFVGTNLTVCGEVHRVQLWDTAGQERYRSLIPIYLRDAAAAIFVFDITYDKSLSDLESWIELYRQSKTDKSVMVACGNKIDLKSKQNYNEETLKFLGHKYQMKHFLVSALSGMGVSEMFQDIVNLVYNQKKKKNKQFDLTTHQIMQPYSSQNLHNAQMSSRSNGEKDEGIGQKSITKEQENPIKIEKDKLVTNKIQGGNRCC